MRDKIYHAYLDSHERQLAIHSLVSSCQKWYLRTAEIKFQSEPLPLVGW